MREKIVENWLTNANELSYTVAFCQILNIKGYKLIRVSEKKTSLEQGKDIVAIDKNNDVHCFQLKAGRVTTSVWEKEILPQLGSLTEVMPVHPALPDFKDWKCYLVINGVINDEASQAIKNYQDTRKLESKRGVELITTQSLLSDFQEYFGKYIPDNLILFEKFLELYNASSYELIEVKQYSMYFEVQFKKIFEDKKISQNQVIQLLNSSLVINAMLLGKKYEAENYTAILQGWLVVLMNILAAAQFKKLSWPKIVPIVDLIFSEVIVMKDYLKNDLRASDLIVREGGSPYSEALLFRQRFTSITGLISAVENAERYHNNKYSVDNHYVNWFVENLSNIRLECEADGVSLLNSSLFLGHNNKGDESVIYLHQLFMALLDAAYSKGGLADPYHSFDEVMKSNLSIRLPEKIDENFKRTSYILEPSLILHIKMDNREFIADNWRKITYVHLMNFLPKYDYGYFQRNTEGTLYSKLDEHTKSWSTLKNDAFTKPKELPTYLTEKPYLLFLLIAIYPYRLNNQTVKLLDLSNS